MAKERCYDFTNKELYTAQKIACSEEDRAFGYLEKEKNRILKLFPNEKKVAEDNLIHLMALYRKQKGDFIDLYAGLLGINHVKAEHPKWKWQEVFVYVNEKLGEPSVPFYKDSAFRKVAKSIKTVHYGKEGLEETLVNEGPNGNGHLMIGSAGRLVKTTIRGKRIDSLEVIEHDMAFTPTDL